MPLPQPKTALNNACSVIFDNTLYTYSADAFQSLQLKPGAKWKVLPQGEKVTGAACVGSTTGTASTSAFFVVGGTGGSDKYHGLQKFTYATGQWESVKLLDKVTHQRVGHSAVYLNSTDSILVYAGNQDGSNAPSTSTFTIGASAPHNVRSYDTSGPPSVNPILLSWSPSEAGLVGGSTWNAQVMLFNAADKKWVDSGASLAAPLAKDTSAIKAVLMTGDDGSKNLLTFDMSASPNAVRRTVLFKGPGVPVPQAAPVRRRLSRRTEHGPSSMEKRAGEPLTLNNWPAYNSTLAPKVTRNNFALAQGSNGMVVIAGGSADDDVLCMFNARDNSWEDADSKLSQARLLSTESSTRSSSTSSATGTSTRLSSTSTSVPSTTSVTASVANPTTATQAPTDAAVAAVPDGSDPQLNTILGAVLGSIFGAALLLALVYMCIRRRKRQGHMEAGHVSRSIGPSPSEKDGGAFDKESLAFGQSPPPAFRGHQQQGSQSSFSSMAILMGRTGEKSAPAGAGRKSSNESRRDSSDSTFKAFKNTISKPMTQPTPVAAAIRPPPPAQQQTRDEKGVAFAASTVDAKPRTLTAGADKQGGNTRRSSGWNRYWSGGSALNLLGFGNGNGNPNNNNNGNNNNINPSNVAALNSRRTTLASDRSSNYSNPHRMTQDSATVPPLFPASAEPRMSFSRVNAHSPTIAVYNDKLNQGMSGRIETQRPISGVSDMSASAYSSGIPESVQDAWDAAAAEKPWGADRSLNDSSTGVYGTPLAPASQGLKPPSQAPPRRNQQPVRDDMSWLNLGGN